MNVGSIAESRIKVQEVTLSSEGVSHWFKARYLSEIRKATLSQLSW